MICKTCNNKHDDFNTPYGKRKYEYSEVPICFQCRLKLIPDYLGSDSKNYGRYIVFYCKKHYNIKSNEEL